MNDTKENTQALRDLSKHCEDFNLQLTRLNDKVSDLTTELQELKEVNRDQATINKGLTETNIRLEERLAPLTKIIYGLVSITLLSVAGAVLTLVLK